MNKVAVIGAGFAGLSSAAILAKEGYDVTVYEKNSSAGGRARKFETSGFTFDMGPSWYWMPDVFEKFFNHFGKSVSDYYSLVRLDPSYRIYFGKNDSIDLPATANGLVSLFDQLEPGSGRQLENFLEEGKYKYEKGMNDLVHRPGTSIFELLDFDLIKASVKLHVFQSISVYIRKFFTEPRIIKILEFPVLFLGAKPQNTPALYSLMNYADMSLGTWYPMGGMYKIVEAMTSLAKSLGVKFQFDSAVEQLNLNAVKIKGIYVNGEIVPCDYVVASADYHHVEQSLIPEKFRRYSKSYWETRVMAPSSLLFFVGLNKKVKGLLHQTLFFDEDFNQHAKEIYDQPKWPSAPQFYVSSPSKTDESVAPQDCENLFILIPVAPGLPDTGETREKYFSIVIKRLESILGENITTHIIFKRSYAHNDFASDYNAFKGNAYGLANTLLQTAFFRPGILNKKISNLFYTGQLTVPGPGVPPAIISGQVSARELMKHDRRPVKR
jgi:phytoene desaturase